MAYRRFEAQNARYILGLMNHGFEENLNDIIKNGRKSVGGLEASMFDNVDALVVEEVGKGGIGDVLQAYKDAAIKCYAAEASDEEKIKAACATVDPRYEIIIKNLTRVPIYNTDVDFGDTEEDSRRRVERIIKNPLLYAFYETMKKMNPELESTGELSNGSQWFAQLGFYIQCDPHNEGRNAINAEKIEGWVAPRVAEYCKKEKPTIGLICGAYHLGIEQNLKSPRRRARVLRKMQKFSGYDKEMFKIVQEARYNPDTKIIEVKTLDTGLF